MGERRLVGDQGIVNLWLLAGWMWLKHAYVRRGKGQFRGKQSVRALMGAGSLGLVFEGKAGGLGLSIVLEE